MLKSNLSDQNPLENQSLKTLRWTKLILLIIAIGSLFSIFSSSIARWPMLAWSMYSKFAEPFPAAQTSVYELRAITNSNYVYKFSYSNLLSLERDTVIKNLVNKAIDKKNKKRQKIARQILADLIQKKLSPQTIKNIQIWQLTWTVEPFALPPFNYQHPVKEVMIDDFNVKF